MRKMVPHVLWLGAVMVLMVLVARYYGAWSRPVPAPVVPPSAAILETCHAMYPTQPDLEQACLRRWTVGEDMPGLVSPAARG
jgi:hypothetical protein